VVLRERQGWDPCEDMLIRGSYLNPGPAIDSGRSRIVSYTATGERKNPHRKTAKQFFQIFLSRLPGPVIAAQLRP